jgi:hypothetical protein
MNADFNTLRNSPDAIRALSLPEASTQWLLSLGANLETAYRSDALVEGGEYSGERPFFRGKRLRFKGTRFLTGESVLKEGEGLAFDDCVFDGKYPLWHCDGVEVRGGRWGEGARAGVWYSRNMRFHDVPSRTPKLFRECDGLVLENCAFENALETGWMSRNVRMNGGSLKGTYLFMHGAGLDFRGVDIDGDYAFQYLRGARFTDCTLSSRDALWHAEDVTLERCVVDGEYIAWHSRNVRLIDCVLRGTQPLCYAHGLKLERCRLEGTDRCFERSDVEAGLQGGLESIMNPASGRVDIAGGLSLLIRDPRETAPESVSVTVDGKAA